VLSATSKRLLESWNYPCEEINPDTALVQEAVPPPALGSLNNSVWSGTDGNRRWGSGIFSKHPVEEVSFENSY